MKLIDRINSEEELKSVRDQLGRVIKERLGSGLGKRKLDEFTADFLGAKDFNTALGIARMAESIPVGVETNKKASKSDEFDVLGWNSVLKGVAWEGYASEEEVQDLLDECVDDHVGMSWAISEEINNQGWIRQIAAIASTMSLSHLKIGLSEMTGIQVNDIERCLNEAKAQITNSVGLSNGDFPFRVGEHIGY